MQIFIIIALLVAIVAVIFALQNLAVVPVSLLFWKVNSHLALVLLVTLAVGVLISLLASLPGLIRYKLAASSQKKKLAALETDRNTYQQKAEESEKEIKNLEEQLASLSSELDNQHLPEDTIQHPKDSAPTENAGITTDKSL